MHGCTLRWKGKPAKMCLIEVRPPAGCHPFSGSSNPIVLQRNGHTHTHTHRGRRRDRETERQRDREREANGVSHNINI